MNLTEARIINVKEAKTKYGLKLVLNAQLTKDKTKVACWSNDLNNKAFRSKEPGDIVQLIADKGKYTLLDETSNENDIQMNRLSHDSGSSRSHYTYSHPHSNGSYTPSNEVEDILDLPFLSDVDKRNIMAYIRSQSKLLKFCYDTVCQDFPDLAINDPRGTRSLAVTLLISANTVRDKYKL